MDVITREAGGECVRTIDILREERAHLRVPIKSGLPASSARVGESVECKGSDMDILVEFSKMPGVFRLLGFEQYLSKLPDRLLDLIAKSAFKSIIAWET